MTKITMTVNGERVEGEVAPNTLLVEFLRENLRLTGAHQGCDTAQCGACVILVGGMSAKSCAMLAVSADGANIKTIEGMARPDGSLAPIQAAFREHHALQCGFCTPGMVMSAQDLLNRNPNPTDDEIRGWLEGNLCRCTGYHNIIEAVKAAAETLRS